MKIGIDVGCLGITDQRLKLGVHRVAFNLLYQLGKKSNKNHYFLYSFKPLSKEYQTLFGPKTTNIIAQPTFGWRYLALPLAILKTRPQIFLGLSQSVPGISFCPSVVIVHDLGFERFPLAYKDALRLSRITRQAVSKASRIIAVSQSTKKDLEYFYHVPEDKIEVVYEGCGNLFKPTDKETVERIKMKYRIKSPYFLFVGAFKKTKNLPRIIKAYSYLQARVKNSPILVLAGSDFWFDKEINRVLFRLPANNLVRNLGFVPDYDLPALYTGACAFVSPSLFEGFGITFLEAMKCGCPVIGGNIGATPEVVGRAGVLVNPTKEKEIYRAMKTILDNNKLSQRLIKEGLIQAKNFSWTKFSNQVLKILMEEKKTIC